MVQRGLLCARLIAARQHEFATVVARTNRLRSWGKKPGAHPACLMHCRRMPDKSCCYPDLRNILISERSDESSSDIPAIAKRRPPTSRACPRTGILVGAPRIQRKERSATPETLTRTTEPERSARAKSKGHRRALGPRSKRRTGWQIS